MMYASYVDSKLRPSRRLPPVIHWSPHYSALSQIAVALAITGAVCATCYFAFTVSAFNGTAAAGTLIHEAFHAIANLAFNRHWGEIVLRDTGGGHALVYNSSQSGTIVTAMAGIVGTAWLSALLLAIGITRVCISAVLGFGGLIIVLITAFLVSAPGDQLVIVYGCGVAAIFAGVAPFGGLTKSVCILVAGAALTWAVVFGLPYIDVDFVNGDLSRPSDSMIFAHALGRSELGDVPELLKMLIIIGYMVAALLSWAWVARHS